MDGTSALAFAVALPMINLAMTRQQRQGIQDQRYDDRSIDLTIAAGGGGDHLCGRMPVGCDVHVHLNGSTGAGGASGQDEVVKLLNQILEQGRQIMDQNTQAVEALRKIDVATTRMAATSATNAGHLKEISDDIDELLKRPVTPEVIAELQAKADLIDTFSQAGVTESEFLRQIAAKWQSEPVPVPVPEPVPVPA